MKIQRATEKDIEQLANLMNQEDICEHSFDSSVPIPSIKETKENIKESFKGKSTIFFVARTKEDILGTISVSIDRRGKKKIGRIQDIVIDEKQRGKGIGKELVKKAEEYFKKKKCIRMQSFVREKNVNSQNFWKKQGFSLEKTNGFVITKKLK